jgi:hypothetical protein
MAVILAPKSWTKFNDMNSKVHANKSMTTQVTARDLKDFLNPFHTFIAYFFKVQGQI